VFALRKCSVFLLDDFYFRVRIPIFFFFLAKWPLNCVFITEINHSNNFLFCGEAILQVQKIENQVLLHIIFSTGTILNVGKIVIVKIEVG
jgi:hypothetical protein